MKEFLGILEASPLSTAEVAQRSGVHKTTIDSWGPHASPRLFNFEAVVSVLGYRVVLIPDAAEPPK